MDRLKTKDYIGFGDYTFAKLDEFGYSFQDFVSGVPIPAQGAHINLHAVGEFRGDRLHASMRLIDHVRLLPNGRVELNVYGVLTDSAGKAVYFYGSGVAESSANGTLPLAENIYMHSNHPEYAWMNTRQFWANGVVDPKGMSLKVHVFGA